eukprot:Protomagalhaensia_sp_Gyna_25__2116@NODE_2143_length_1262_cov_66_062960_g1770_i0_p2_GENE_NODE_2143_length_1262_cov_66_062960_g1770_i0NODE_2143_length_1262_cov_66_062960_g1770_i0_p2_ORF_typecomplete_len134_score26_67ABM/PF03992_16/1_4e12DUF4188/PF13826_6/0_058_NODE_2143_length_1262_cov_66_062960_g1770_i0291692
MCVCVPHDKSELTGAHISTQPVHIFFRQLLFHTIKGNKMPPVELVVVVKFQEADLKALTPALEHLARESQKENGCHKYTLNAAANEPNTRIILEEWESDEHLTAHQQTKHFQDWCQQSNGKAETSLYRISKLV